MNSVNCAVSLSQRFAPVDVEQCLAILVADLHLELREPVQILHDLGGSQRLHDGRQILHERVLLGQPTQRRPHFLGNLARSLSSLGPLASVEAANKELDEVSLSMRDDAPGVRFAV